MAQIEFLTGGSSEDRGDAYYQAVFEGMVDNTPSSRASFEAASTHKIFWRNAAESGVEAIDSEYRVAHLFGTSAQRALVIDEWFGEGLEKPLVPTTFKEQLELLPPTQEEREEVVKALEAEIVAVLEANRTRVYDSSSRAKSAESIQSKQDRRVNKTAPMHDIYGIRVVTDDKLISASNALWRHFWPPHSYPWGRESIRDYKIEREGTQVPYEARHIIIPFGGRGMQQIAEVQLLNKDQMQAAIVTREVFERKVGKSK